MGLLDKVKNAVKGNPDKVTDTVDKVTDKIDEKTGGKYTEHLDKVDDQVGKFVGEGESDSAADETQQDDRGETQS